MTVREWATPLTIGGFGIIAVTGILMFFHWDTGLNKVAHQWLGWVLVGAVALHAFANFGMVRRYFRNGPALAVMGVSLTVLAASFLPLGGKDKPKPHVAAVQALLAAPVSVVAQVAGKELGVVVGRLEAAGIPITGEQSIRQAVGPDRERQMTALGAVFAK